MALKLPFRDYGSLTVRGVTDCLLVRRRLTGPGIPVDLVIHPGYPVGGLLWLVVVAELTCPGLPVDLVTHPA